MEDLSPDARRILFYYIDWSSLTIITDLAIEEHWYGTLKTCLQVGQIQFGVRRTVELILKPKNAPVLEWVIKNGYCDLSDPSVCAAAACMPDVTILQRLRAVGFAWNHETTHVAARCGHKEHLEWALSNGCPWRGETYALAIKKHTTSYRCV